MRSISLLLLSCLLLGFLLAQVSCQDDGEKKENGETMPRMLDFETFKQLFKKSYASLQEEMARAKIFMRRTLQVFVSLVRYLHKRASSYLASNHMSDWTDEELKRIKLKGKDVSDESKPTSEVHENIEEELEQIKSSDDPLDKGLVVELKNLELPPSDRKQVKLPLPGAVTSIFAWFRSRAVEASEESQEQIDWRTSNNLYVDHRSYGCTFNARNQGNCGSCYAFATVALYEWLYCRYTGRLKAFSEQYFVDCGQRAHLSGCDGGHLDYALAFVDRYGLEPRSSWPYSCREDFCPFPHSMSYHSMGKIRVGSRGFGYVYLRDLDSELNDAPILINIQVNDDFDFYGGGLDQNRNCVQPAEDNIHAMLIVGRGMEEGEEFYLVRNSYSTRWGLSGYWKVSKSALNRCLYRGVAYKSRSYFNTDPDDNLNRSYDSRYRS